MKIQLNNPLFGSNCCLCKMSVYSHLLIIYLFISTIKPEYLGLCICSVPHSSSAIKCSSVLGDRISIPDYTSPYIEVQAGFETR